jgi:hypothetical protein
MHEAPQVAMRDAVDEFGRQPALAAPARTPPGGAQLPAPPDDSTEVDTIRYEKIHESWLGAHTPS